MKVITLTLTAILLANSLLGQGLCNAEDLNYLNDNITELAALSQDCATECLGVDDLGQCVEDCILASAPISQPCASCFSTQIECVIENCFIVCILGTPDDCETCALANCLEPFNECAGIVDLDNDGFSTLNDCDDSNPNVYPDAPSTHEGIDNNCDGEISPDEQEITTCIGDFDENGEVGSSDLTVLLANFGCSINCPIDVNGEPGITASDLTSFISLFGLSCTP